MFKLSSGKYPIIEDRVGDTGLRRLGTGIGAIGGYKMGGVVGGSKAKYLGSLAGTLTGNTIGKYIAGKIKKKER